ncbi:MAG: hypothetical protein HY704_11775 [Gemmatimonadetes bacterium]|nr:hypothetical protein [Gemmatimonadota bacterium]
MKKMMQIRNVPEEVHRRLKARAALAGMSMSDYVLREIERALQRPTREELLESLARLPGVALEPEPAAVIREEREGR